MADNEDVNALRRRGRRRLVGAIALVLVAVIVLPMVLDSEPRPAPPLSVRIPGEEETAFAPQVASKPLAGATGSVPSAAQAGASDRSEPAAAARAEPAAAPEQKSQAAAAAKPPAASLAKAQAAGAGGERFAVQVGAFRELEKVKEVTARLAAAKVPHYTEPVATAAGTATRVRAGPYPSREAAEQALRRLQDLGFKGGKVVEQSS